MEVIDIETLGERIRTIRKQRKLTLEALAGDELTKGMLSLIENNKANPSMESLTYIAKRLGIEVSELLVAVNFEELRTALHQVERLYNTDFFDITDEYAQIISIVEPFIPKLTHGYESARLLELYSISMYYEGKSDWQSHFNRAAEMYERMNLTTRRAKMGIFLSSRKFIEHDYKTSLKVLQDERTKLAADHAFIDPMSKIDFDFQEVILLFAVGDYSKAEEMMNEVIHYSKENRVFYNVDRLYRLAAARAMMTHDVEKADYYKEKLQLYSKLAEDDEAFYFTKFLDIHYLNSYKKSYEEAYTLINHYIKKFDLILSPYLSLEKGKALYGLNQHEEALIHLKAAEIQEFVHHPLDLSLFYEREAYMALCYQALGNETDATKYAQIAVDNVSPMPHTPYKDFIIETYKKIRSSQ